MGIPAVAPTSLADHEHSLITSHGFQKQMEFVLRVEIILPCYVFQNQYFPSGDAK
uniref:Uncharacterized protein n=1 Tax=Rhizophora mucronata TaxID=61149 RepID=A0A2P2QR09_RHIMU